MDARKLSVDLDSGFAGIKQINVSQYDVGVPIEIDVYFQGSLFEITSGSTVTIEGKKLTNGDAFQVENLSHSGSTVSFDTTAVMTDIYGNVVCKLVITDSGVVAGTATFIMKVQKAPVQSTDVISSTGFESSIQAGVAQYASTNGLLTLVGASTASGMTDTTKIYIYTGSESGYTYGDWYYYNGSAWTDGGSFMSNGQSLVVDSELSSSSTNAVRNSAIFAALSEKAISYYFSSQADFVTKATAMPLHSSAVFLMANSTSQSLGFSYTAKGTITKTTSDICDLIAMDGTTGFFVCRYVISTGVMTINEISGGSDITIDSSLSTTSENPVQNKVVKGAVDSLNASLTDLQTAVSNIQGGTAIPVTLASAMTDTTAIYLYMGNETGYNYGDWYYYDGDSWEDGGTYGTGTISNNARNLLMYILRNVAFADDSTYTAYLDALEVALKVNGTPETESDYTIYWMLTNVTSDVETTQIASGSSFTCTLSADTSGYSISDITITMGGTDVTSDVYSAGVVTIASVTGDVVITATATDDTIIYQLPSAVTFTGDSSEIIATDIRPLSTDADFTIAFNWTSDGTYANNTFILSCMEGTSPYWGVKIQINSDRYEAPIFGRTKYLTDLNIATATTRSMVIRHTAGDTNCEMQIYFHSSGTSVTYTIGSSVKTITSKLYIGGNGYIGTLNNFVWRNYRYSDDEVTAYFGS